MTVHISIDDVGQSLRLLAHERPVSIFDSDFFALLKKWHNQFNAKFTLYVFSDSFLLSDMPVEYTNDFHGNAQWLKWGYHGSSKLPFIEELNYEEEFKLLDKAFDKLGAGKTDILRLHYWQVSPEQKKFLHSKGITCLLYPDDDKLPYDCNDTFYEHGLPHLRTRVRFENIDTVNPETLAIGKNHIAAFTHEWCFPDIIMRMEESLRLYSKCGYRFI